MNLVFLLEEPSAREMLKGLLPRVLPHPVQIRYIVFDVFVAGIRRAVAEAA